MHALEPKVREFCARALDPLVGAGRLRLRRRSRRADADAHDRDAARHPGGRSGRGPRPRRRAPRAPSPASRWTSTADEMIGQGDFFADYLDWRAEHPSDDLMTELLFTEFEDETGTTRRLTRDEVLIYVSVLSGAGNETTNRLIGWMGKVLARPPRAAARAGRGPLAGPERHRGAPAVRAAHAPRRPLRHPRRRAPRHDRARRAAP